MHFSERIPVVKRRISLVELIEQRSSWRWVTTKQYFALCACSHITQRHYFSLSCIFFAVLNESSIGSSATHNKVTAEGRQPYMRTFYTAVNLPFICRRGVVAGECPDAVDDL